MAESQHRKARSKRPLYPGVKEVEIERSKKNKPINEQPDFIAGAPNYDKFKGWSTEEVLIWLNID